MTVLLCAICGKDTFFLACDGEECTLTCSGCGATTGAKIDKDDRDQLVGVP